jgi:hypothetical protein
MTSIRRQEPSQTAQSRTGTTPGLLGLGTVDGAGQNQVKSLQTRLHQMGFLSGDLSKIADGKFGPQTKAALEAFQARAGVKVDGVFGPESAAALQAFDAKSTAGRAQVRATMPEAPLAQEAVRHMTPADASRPVVAASTRVKVGLAKAAPAAEASVQSKAMTLVEEIHRPGGARASVIRDMFKTLSPAQAAELTKTYNDGGRRDLVNDLRGEMFAGGTVTGGTNALVELTKNGAIAEKALQCGEAIIGLGTDKTKLQRALKGTSEEDFKRISASYQAMYREPLESAIAGEWGLRVSDFMGQVGDRWNQAGPRSADFRR